MASFVFTVGVTSCSIFGADDEDPGPAPSSSDDGGIPPVQGGEADRKITIAISNEQQWLVQGQSLQIPVSLVRGKSALQAVNVTVEGLPDGVTTVPLTIAGDQGTLELRAATTAKQGPFELKVTGAADGPEPPAPTTASLKVFVRGPSGSVDTTFGTQGLVVDPFFVPATPADLVVLPDGQIVVAGDCNEIVGAYACVARLDANGKIDATFPKSRAHAFIGGASRLLVLPDNKLLFAFRGGGGIGIGRLKTDGDRDPDFTADQLGKTLRPETGCANQIHDLALLSNGDAFVAFDYDTTTNCTGSVHAIGTGKFAPNGTARTNWFYSGFGPSGWGVNAWAAGLTVRPGPNQELVYVGSDPGGIGIIQLISEGTTGTTFSKRVPRTVVAESAYVGAVLLPNGNVLGAFRDSSAPFVAAFKGDGSGLDTAFGANGIASPPAPGATPRALLRQKDGKILLAVDLFDPAIFRLNEDGRVDTGFGTGGKVGTLFPQSASIVRMVPQPGADRVIVLARPAARDVTEVTRIWL